MHRRILGIVTTLIAMDKLRFNKRFHLSEVFTIFFTPQNTKNLHVHVISQLKTARYIFIHN